MNKYKLINKTTGEEHICEKVVIDGFDYYVNDETVGNYCWYINTYTNKLYHSSTLKPDENSKKIIPNTDLPKVMDEVEELAEKIIPNLIHKKYVKTGFIGGYNKSQETHSNSDDDMVEFAEWCENLQKDNKEIRRNNPSITRKELLHLWKEQRPKTLYYE